MSVFHSLSLCGGVVAVLLIGLGCGNNRPGGPSTGDPVKSADPVKPIAKEDLHAAKAKLADLDKAIAAKEKELGDLKAEAEAVRQQIALAEAPKDKVYRSPQELFADMPKDAYPRLGEAFAPERRAAWEWFKTNRVGKQIEWKAKIAMASRESGDYWWLTVGLADSASLPPLLGLGKAARVFNGKVPDLALVGVIPSN